MPAIIRWSPARDMVRLSDAMDRMFEDAWTRPRPARGWLHPRARKSSSVRWSQPGSQRTSSIGLVTFSNNGYIVQLFAYAEAGRFPEALTASQRAIALATNSGDRQSATVYSIQMKFYQAHAPYHEREERP